jgi:hypothetical protein
MESAELRSDQAPSMPLKQETQGWNKYLLSKYVACLGMTVWPFLYHWIIWMITLDEQDTSQRTGEKIKATSKAYVNLLFKWQCLVLS